MSVDGAAAIRTKMKEIVPEYYNGHDDLLEEAGILAGQNARANPQLFSPKGTSEIRHATRGPIVTAPPRTSPETDSSHRNDELDRIPA